MPDSLIAPHGGELVDLVVEAARAEELREASRDWPSLDLSDRLEALSAYQEEVSSGARIIHRVRIGPFLERDEATRVAGELRANMNLDGVVMSAD